MEQKINVAELLKDCPKGMELNCTNYNGIVTFEEIYSNRPYPIQIKIKHEGREETLTLTKYGQTCLTPYNKCVIFPKGKTTWEGFKRPFRDGDILAYDISSTKSTIFIYRYDNPSWNTSYYVALSGYAGSLLIPYGNGALKSYEPNVRFATQEEIERLFKAITSNGYKWNPETKTLEKLSNLEFKEGDVVVSNRGDIHLLRTKDSSYCAYRTHWTFDNFDSTLTTGVQAVRLATEKEKQKLFDTMKEKGFKWNPETKTLESIQEFKDGDIVSTADGAWIGITLGGTERTFMPTYCVLTSNDRFIPHFDKKEKWVFDRLATEEEKEKLFNAMKKKGYKWNAETRTLDNLTVKDFNDGDICYLKTKDLFEFIFIFKSNENSYYINRYVNLNGYGDLMSSCAGFICDITNVKELRHATQEEKQKLFNVIKEKGLKWNPETKTLEKLCPFNPGDVLVSKAGNLVLFSHIDNEQTVYYHCILYPFGDHFNIIKGTSSGVGRVDNCKLATYEQRNQLFDRLQKSGYKYNIQTNKLEKLIEPNFKVGDRIRNIRSNSVGVIEKLTDTGYDCRFDYGYFFISFKDQHNFMLVPNKFDINTLVPFKSEVLVRSGGCCLWKPATFGFFNGDVFCVLGGNMYKQCIPYKGNEHLMNTTRACNDFYKTWE